RWRVREEAIATARVLGDERFRLAGEAVAHLGPRVLVGEAVAAGVRADELVTEAVDHAEVDRFAGHDLTELPLQVHERERAREHALRSIVERDRDREDDRLRVEPAPLEQ